MMSFLEITSPLVAIYFICTVFGGTMMLLQLLMMLFSGGVGFDGDGSDGGDGGDSHSQTADIFKVLSLRTVIAGITFFGLGGLAGVTGGTSMPVSVLLAIISGLIALYLVYYLYLSIAQLKSDGSISSATLVGSLGNVYVRIPADGTGKVLVNQQERTMEYEAVSVGGEIKTGVPIRIVRVVSSTIVEVQPVSKESEALAVETNKI